MGGNKVIVLTGVSSGIGKAFVFHALKYLNQEDLVWLFQNNQRDIF